YRTQVLTRELGEEGESAGVRAVSLVRALGNEADAIGVERQRLMSQGAEEARDPGGMRAHLEDDGGGREARSGQATSCAPVLPGQPPHRASSHSRRYTCLPGRDRCGESLW